MSSSPSSWAGTPPPSAPDPAPWGTSADRKQVDKCQHVQATRVCAHFYTSFHPCSEPTQDFRHILIQVVSFCLFCFSAETPQAVHLYSAQPPWWDEHLQLQVLLLSCSRHVHLSQRLLQNVSIFTSCLALAIYGWLWDEVCATQFYRAQYFLM